MISRMVRISTIKSAARWALAPFYRIFTIGARWSFFGGITQLEEFFSSDADFCFCS